MICRTCGTEIADKALICYRCGAATADPKVPPPAARRRRVSLVPAGLALVVLVFAALFMGQAGQYGVPPPAIWAVSAIAVVVIVWSLMSKRAKG